MSNSLPNDAASRKAIPLATGLLDYFPNALIAVAALSYIGNEQHNPGSKLHWDRSKSTDHDDCLMRHFMARGTNDTDGVRHRTKVAWRALAALEQEIEGGTKTVTAKNLYDETQVIAERQDRIDTSEKHVEFLTNGEHDGTNRTHWKIESNIKQHRRAATEAERNAYLDSFSANPPNCDGNRHPMMAEADRLTGKGE